MNIKFLLSIIHSLGQKEACWKMQTCAFLVGYLRPTLEITLYFGASIREMPFSLLYAYGKGMGMGISCRPSIFYGQFCLQLLYKPIFTAS